MDSIYVFFIRNDVWIYILCSLGLLWFLSELFRAQSQLRGAMFGLERESALRTRNSALTMVIILGSIILFVAYVNIQIRPTLPAALLQPPTPTPDPLRPPLLSPTPPEPTLAPSPTSPVAPTVTLPGDAPPAEVQATAPATRTVEAQPALPTAPPIAGCAPLARISDPQAGDRIVGTLSIFGTADTPDFAHYLLEISGPQTNQRWADILGRRIDQPVNDGFLGGNIYLGEWQPGDYLLRLTVVNQEEVITNQCVVAITLGG